mgnify:CR=1
MEHCFDVVSLINAFTIPINQLGSIIKRYSTRPGEHCIDGYLFLKHFCSLREKKQREFEASKVRFQQKKERILNMGQHIDILPKTLGR